MADQNNAEEHDMMTSGMLQRATTPELIALRARKEDARFGVYAEWAGILLIAGVLSRVFMTYVFNACVGDWLRDGHLQAERFVERVDVRHSTDIYRAERRACRCRWRLCNPELALYERAIVHTKTKKWENSPCR